MYSKTNSVTHTSSLLQLRTTVVTPHKSSHQQNGRSFDDADSRTQTRWKHLWPNLWNRWMLISALTGQTEQKRIPNLRLYGQERNHMTFHRQDESGSTYWWFWNPAWWYLEEPALYWERQPVLSMLFLPTSLFNQAVESWSVDVDNGVVLGYTATR